MGRGWPVLGRLTLAGASALLGAGAGGCCCSAAGTAG